MVHKKLDALINRHYENKLSHAFLIETNNYEKCEDDLTEVIKKILSDGDSENINELIDSNNLPSFIIIRPDGASIKKQQITDLKNRLLCKPIYTNFNVYIISNAETLNVSSANTMLKFIEEPEDKIIGFFITDNKEKIIETIRSRCQLLSVMYNIDHLYEDLNIDQQEFEFYVKILFEYLKLLETDLEMCFIEGKNIVLKNLKERKDYNIFFKIMLDIYESKLQKLISPNEKYEDFEFILVDNLKLIIKKMQVIEKTIQNLRFNPNLELMLDNFVIEMRNLQ